MVHKVVSQKAGRGQLFRLPAKTSERLKRLSFQASLDENRRVGFGEIVTRALDALERELRKKTAGRRRKKAQQA